MPVRHLQNVDTQTFIEQTPSIKSCLSTWKQKIDTASREAYIWAIQNSSPEPRTKHTKWGSSCQINRTNVMNKNGVFLNMYPAKAKREYSGSALKSIGRDGVSRLLSFPFSTHFQETDTPYTFFGDFLSLGGSSDP